MGGVFLLLSKISFYGTTLILVVLVLVLSLKFNKKTEEKINNEVSNKYIASYFDGEYQTEIPDKGDGYVVDKIVCDNGATATWDNEEWGINIRNATEKIKCSIYFKYQFEQEFDYTGTEQVFTVPKTGTYKLETWGAQGGTYTEKYLGGYGGYSVGKISLKIDDELFINIGGAGTSGKATISQNYGDGGYNGGGSRSGYESTFELGSSGGGGATHIAIKSGLLNTLENYKDKIIIVSGGGGGSGYVANGWNYNPTNIASGGGYKGNVGQTNDGRGGMPGTQTSGAFFGQGSNCGTINVCDGGGGGYYGGGTGHSGASGGSGYIGNSLLTNKAMYCYNCEESSEESTKTISTTCVEETPTENCAKKGNGYARITYIG